MKLLHPLHWIGAALALAGTMGMVHQINERGLLMYAAMSAVALGVFLFCRGNARQ